LGNVGITLSTSDHAGANILATFRDMGFEETDRDDVLRLGDIRLFVVEPFVVPVERFKTPSEPNPYPVDYDSLAEAYGIDYYVVASRHWAKSGKPSLTVHPPGNFGKAMYGGRPRELQRTVAKPMRDVFLELISDPPKGFAVSLEATHHSPTQFETPMFFAEVGSRETQWRDEAVGRYLAEAIVNGIKAEGDAPVAIGFGGGHYCPTFTVMEEETAFGHMAAKYAIDLLTPELTSQMVDCTLDGVDKVVLDKGLKGHQRKRVEVAVRKLDLEIEGL
jgi:D-aminoacyl-tRNA deacylase